MAMTVKRAIELADGLRPNMIEEGRKAAWVMEFEMRLRREQGEEYSPMSYPENGEEELLAKDGFEEMYILWLCAQIDFAMKEYDGWNASAAGLNALIGDFKRQRLRDELPDKRDYKGVYR